MKILALDAALGPFSVALAVDGTVWSERSDRNDALEAGLGRVAGLLRRAGVRLAELDRIAVGLGPGSFTGIRIALSFAKALAYAANVPLVGISSYDVLTPASAVEPYLTVVSGRPGIVCARLHRAGRSAAACGAGSTVVDRLLGECVLDSPLTIYAATEAASAEITVDSNPVIRLVAQGAGNPAVVIAQLARGRDPSPSPHALSPDYGEVPAVSVPKAGTKTAP
jgi:tRNA threonylcarbamoyladenosine biosynthesis protein TsaB